MVIPDVFLVCPNTVQVKLASFVYLNDVFVEVNDGGLKGLQCNEYRSFCLDSFFIILLVPNLLSFIEFVDLLVEVRTWKRLWK